MKKKSILVWVGLIVLLLAACSSGRPGSSVYDPAASNDLQDISVEDLEKNLISDFYDAIYEINQQAKQYGTGSLHNSVREYKARLNKLVQYEFEENLTEYSNYIKNMQGDYFVTKILEYVCAEPTTVDYSSADYAWAYILKDSTEEVLKIKLPFEYEKQVEFLKVEGQEIENEYIFDEAKEKILTYANAMISSGADFTYDDSAAHPSFLSEYIEGMDTTYGPLNLSFSLTLRQANANSKGNYSFEAFFAFDEWVGEDIKKLRLNGAEFNTTQMSQFGGALVEFSTCSLEMFDSQKDELMNHSFREFQASLKDASTIEIQFCFDNGSECVVLLDEEYTKQVMSLLDIFEYTQNIHQRYL